MTFQWRLDRSLFFLISRVQTNNVQRRCRDGRRISDESHTNNRHRIGRSAFNRRYRCRRKPFGSNARRRFFGRVRRRSSSKPRTRRRRLFEKTVSPEFRLRDIVRSPYVAGGRRGSQVFRVKTCEEALCFKTLKTH